MITINLDRKQFREDGIFGELFSEDVELLIFTLEHAYKNPNDQEGGYQAKVPQGSYICRKTRRTLVEEPKEEDYFDTYEILDVHDHSGILFHVGNYNKDSNGCVILGLGLGRTTNNGQMLTSSKQAMAKFMQHLKGIDSFKLIIKDCV